MEEPRRRIAAPPAGFQIRPASSSLPFSLNWRGRGLRRARAGYTPAISRALTSPCHSRARASRLPLPVRLSPPFFPRAHDFPLGVASVGRHGDAFLHEATPYARKSWQAGRCDSEIARTPRRRHGDAITTMVCPLLYMYCLLWACLINCVLSVLVGRED